MAVDRKRVTICSENEAFARALRVLLDGFDIDIRAHPDIAGHDDDVLVWRIAGRVPQSLTSIASQSPTLVLAADDQLLSAVDAGCRGFLPLGASLEQVRDAVNTMAEGGAVVPPDLLGRLLRHLVDRRRRAEEMTERVAGLTEREQQVFELALMGARKEEIAERLFISPATARTHLQRVYRKLGIHSQAELMGLAARVAATEKREEQ